MAQDIFIKLNGIDGESLDSKHKNEIEVLSWGWRVEQQSSAAFGSGIGAGKATAADLVFDHYMDSASPNLMKYCLTGKPIDQAVLTVRKAGGTPLEYIKYTLSEVLVTLVQPSGSNGDTGIREQVHLSFVKVKQEHVKQNAQGGNGGVVTAAYDFKASKEA
ncbi:Hcp1 family type VI secretion system effector [Caballeronia pedi]|uniref:Hcp1 family type VI secretion system effector n=1 Tax=Caballeronia pedi TaxID=1777141 RepID=A0A157ZVJ4_9BURK|nr:type VI secretion system tube protein Hcp [Caballeronia pedi]SAK49525.1 Hcp1 family type VI secretion system effector [Caballeronia pedi]